MTRYLISGSRRCDDLPRRGASRRGRTLRTRWSARPRTPACRVFGGGLKDQKETSDVGIDGTISDSVPQENKQYVGGFAVIDVPSREEALQWAAKFAVACRCAQDVREFVPDPAV